MLDIIGAIVITAIYAAIVGLLVGLSPLSRPTKLVACAVAALWPAAIILVAVSGGLAPGATGPVPVPVLLLVSMLALLFGGWRLLPGFREALLAVPLAALVGVNATRLVGIFFLLLAAEGRLSAPFAPSAGWGDIAVGIAAIVLVMTMMRGSVRPIWLGTWNALGTLDLLSAVSLGALSAPGTPFRVFTEGAGTQAIGTLPWTLIPAALVPLFLLVHVTIAVRLKSMQGAPHTLAAVRGT
ncbi:hypothetical protein [Reyranella sp. CPCC 100927]|uniref:hypothetical protein n=1 Tax=Reyranella sp. CPCC 100927 TaxID=2599616 RepID=UPI0011B61C1D|nr:hypothetical protein [Reyranella sp. CPCC 100927]TWT00690.1 hypothetical protein FQU96_33070 [Reyranella sp. CPCC 100927]